MRLFSSSLQSNASPNRNKDEKHITQKICMNTSNICNRLIQNKTKIILGEAYT